VRKYDPAKSVAEPLKHHTGLRTCPRERVADIPQVQFGPLVHDLVTIWWPIDAGALISAEKPRRDER